MALPAELWNQIIWDPVIQRKELWSLCATSHLLSAVAYPALYSTVELKGRDKVKLAIDTFTASPELLLFVCWFSLTLGPADYELHEWFTDNHQRLTTTINGMTNLRRMSIDGLFDYIESEEALPWTCDLDLSHIERLDVQKPITRPPSQLFAGLPAHLPLLTVNGYRQDVRNIDGVIQIRCEQLEGEVEHPLQFLKQLEVCPIFGFWIMSDFAPNLQTLAIMASNSRITIGKISKHPTFRRIKNLGSIFCLHIKPNFLEHLSRLHVLEVISIHLPSVPYKKFCETEVKSMAQATPTLHTIIIMRTKDFSPKGAGPGIIRVWKRQVGINLDGKGGENQWSMLEEEVESHADAVRRFLGLI